MSIQKINISIKDDSKFADVASLVDKEGFLQDIDDIRQRLHIDIPYHLPNLPYQEVRYVVDAFNNSQITVSQVRTLLQEFCNSHRIYLTHLDRTLASASIYAEALMNKYQRKPIYFPVILASLLMGNVQDYDFLSSYVLHLDSSSVNQIVNGNQLFSELSADNKLTAIAVTHESKIGDITILFEFLQKYQFGVTKVDKTDRMAEIMQDSMEPYIPHRRKTSIRRVREWYWSRKNGKRPIVLALELEGIERADYKVLLKDKYKNREILFLVNTTAARIKKAINRYKKILEN